MPQGTSIKDIVHGYVDLSAFERLIVNSPWFQRLRRVKQNDVSSSVYPTMQATRFEHSLGAMHLAGECLSAALDNDDPPQHAEAFLRHVLAELRVLYPELQLDENKVREFAVCAARLYGLLHDIGHPPYSHLVESCFSAHEIGLSGSAGSDWHEVNSAEIIQKHLKEYILEIRNRLSLAKAPLEDCLLDLVARLAQKSISAPSLLALKTLVDAVIDVDRMDFVLRDGKTSGAEFGVYDARRLTQAFRVHVEYCGPDQIRAVYIRPSHKALSAIESLLQERYKIYRWVHFHHRVMQTKALMRMALRHANVFFQSPGDHFDPTNLRAERYVRREAGAPYALLGDSYIEQYLDHAFLCARNTVPATPLQARVLTALKVLVLREDLGTPLWKRAEGYSVGSRSFEYYLEHGSNNKEGFASISDPPNIQHARELHGSIANWVAATFSKPGNRAIMDSIIEDLNSGSEFEFLLLETSTLKGLADDKIIIAGENRVRSLQSTSSVAQAIAAARKGDVHLFAFHFGPTQIPANARETVINEARKRVAAAIVNAYDKHRTVRSDFETALQAVG